MTTAPDLAGRRGSQVRASRARGPIDPRLVRRASATRGYLIAGVAVGCAVAVLTLIQADLLAKSLSDIFATQQLTSLAWAVPGLAAVFTGKAALTWINQWLAHRSAAAVKSQLRREVLAARLEHPIEAGSAGLITLVTQGLDALDGFYSKYLPQLLLAMTVPLIVGVAILTADLTSAFIVAVTLPLIPLFMALVGWTTEARTKRRWRTQTRLAHHFADLIAGLPTLQVFGRAKAQAEGLARTEAAHRRETMQTLRLSFLSALVLELLATLSVAIVAVSVGFRVVFDQLDLRTALFVLILAPEVYLPVRQVGVHYHDSADGMAAAETAFALIDGTEREAWEPGAAGPGVALAVRDVSHTFPGSEAPALPPVSFEAPVGELVVITGPSGGGKTTLLNVLLGFLRPTQGEVLVDDGPGPDAARRWRRRLAYVPQNPGMIHGTVADNIRLGAPDAGQSTLRDALDRAGAPELSLEQPVGDAAVGLSAGERRRVAMARAIVRVEQAGADVIVLDEPTAGLDAEAEARLIEGLRLLAATAVVVSHRPAMIAAADRVVGIGSPSDQGL